VPIGDDTYAYRRYLPHLQKENKTYFVTWATACRRILPPRARDFALACCVANHECRYWLECAVVMPDHVHMLMTPYAGNLLDRLLRRIKGYSARLINAEEQSSGAVWQREYFDRILRSAEDVRKKGEYICNNPVRAGLVERVDDYPWIWRSWIEGIEKAPAGMPALH
jgi:REP element-mobilizing transposase RayT